MFSAYNLYFTCITLIRDQVMDSNDSHAIDESESLPTNVIINKHPTPPRQGEGEGEENHYQMPQDHEQQQDYQQQEQQHEQQQGDK